MTIPLRDVNRQHEFSMLAYHEALSVTYVRAFYGASRRLRVDGVKYVSQAGQAEDVTNHVLIQIKNGATVLATLNTLTGQTGSIVANTPTDMVLSSTDTELVLAPGDVLTLSVTVTGVVSLSEGSFQLDVREF